MKNITYLEKFYKKHNLSGKVKVRYSSPIVVDEFMKEVEFDNGDVVSINDIIFDIESNFPNYVFKAWLEGRKDNDVSFIEWFKSNNSFIPPDIDRSSVKEYQDELSSAVENVKQIIDTMFKLIPDDGDSDEDEDE